ncbi:Histone deacetylase 8, partial [Tieghemiomyces parasiticus]
FCYVNDIVLATLAMRKAFDTILIIDCDLHHHCGVEAAFQHSEKVFTLSFHRHAPGFFPGTGSCEAVGRGKGKFYCLNVPLQTGLNDAHFHSVFRFTVDRVWDRFRPQAVVMQCGCDGMAQDPNREWNLTPAGLGAAVAAVKSRGVPTLFLGGGGYHHANAARCNTYLTSLICRSEPLDLHAEIPDHDYAGAYAPGHDLAVTAGNMQDENDPAYLEGVMAMVDQRLMHLEQD